jgi:glycolate oxidase FAD binding subunit
VKNVAGYDLSRLFCGSHGSLGMITSATFKLAPIPQASRTVVARFASTQQAAQTALELAASPLTPSCIELTAPEPLVLVRFESTARAAQRMADSAATLLGNANALVTMVDAGDEAALWLAHESATPSELLATATVLPTSVGPLLHQFEQQAADRRLSWRATAHAALGVVHARIGSEPTRQADAVSLLRALVHALGGHVRVVQAPESVRAVVTARDPIGTAAGAAAAVKRQFDPAGVLPWPWPEEVARG